MPNCTGALPTVEGCYLANMVTDVVVRAPGGVGANKTGGAVVAAVGWRAGNKTNKSAKYPSYVESPGNGIYTSTTGAAGSFAKVNDPFNAATGPVGRIELGAATGAEPEPRLSLRDRRRRDAAPGRLGARRYRHPDGRHGRAREEHDVPQGHLLLGRLRPDLDADEQRNDADGPAHGLIARSATPARRAPYCPGVQAWYNAWIKPDPTRADSSGVPSRLVFGLEEVWENRLADQGVGASGPTDFKMIGSYTGGTSCFGLILNFPGCPTASGFGSITTHPDHHDGIFVPDGTGGVTLYDGNDGGVFAQHVDSVQPLSNANWGRGLNNGFNTLMPYQAVMAKDGILYAGLQDNGELRTEASGAEFNTHDGDGTWSAVDPDDSNVVYERQPQSGLQKSSDGGKNWSATTAPSDTFQFVNPFSMDPTDASHLLDAGNQVWETKDGGGSWTSLFTLGTSPAGVAYAMSAIDLRSERYGAPLPTGPHTPDFTTRTARTTVPPGTTRHRGRPRDVRRPPVHDHADPGRRPREHQDHVGEPDDRLGSRALPQ